MRASQLMAQFLCGCWRSSASASDLTEAELNFIQPLLQSSGAGGLAWWQIRHSPLHTAPVGNALQQTFRLQTLLAAKHEMEIQNLFRLMREANLEPLLVKGWAIAQRYPAKGLRPYGDIDLILRPRDRAQAEALLNRLADKTFRVDFEHEELEDFEDQRYEDLLAHSQLVKLGDSDIRVMSEEDHLRFLCIHLLRHGAWRPLWLCDIAVAVEARPAAFDWQRCLGDDPTQAGWVLSTIRLAAELLGAQIDHTPAAKHRLPKWLMPMVLKQWEHPGSADHAPPELIMTSLRHPSHLAKALAARWPDAISASIRMRAPFNEKPRWPFQLANYVRRVTDFGKRLASLAVKHNL